MNFLGRLIHPCHRFVSTGAIFEELRIHQTLNFGLKTVREGLFTYWEAQLNNEKPMRHSDCLQAIILTGVAFNDKRIASLIAEKFGYYFKP